MTARLTWLIDTNVISEMMRPRPDPQVAAFLDSIADEGIGLSSVSVWEVLDGIGRLDPGQRHSNLAERFRDLVKGLFEDRVVEWSEVDAQACALLMEDKRRCGETLDEHIPDTFIAATASTRGLTVVTRHTRLPQHRSQDRKPLALDCRAAMIAGQFSLPGLQGYLPLEMTFNTCCR